MGSAAQQDGGELESGLAAFYDRSVRDVYRYFHRATAGDRQLTEDLTQETFIACVRALRAGEVNATTMPWLMGVARHKLIDHYRRRSRDERKLTLAWSVRDDATTKEFDVTDTEALDALAALSPDHRLVLVLRYVDDLSVTEIATATGRSVRACESLLVRARHVLDDILARDRHV